MEKGYYLEMWHLEQEACRVRARLLNAHAERQLAQYNKQCAEWEEECAQAFNDYGIETAILMGYGPRVYNPPASALIRYIVF